MVQEYLEKFDVTLKLSSFLWYLTLSVPCPILGFCLLGKIFFHENWILNLLYAKWKQKRTSEK
jgi:hypothetical protein